MAFPDLSKVTGGVVDLGGAAYSDVAIADRVFDAANPLVITNGTLAGCRLTRCANIHFSDVNLTKGATKYALQANGGGNIRVTDFRLDAIGSPSDAKAIEFIKVDGFVIADGDLQQFNIGIALLSSDNGQILRSRLHDFNEDCVRLVSARNVLIEDNDFHDFLLVASGAGIHPDAVQGFNDKATLRQIMNITIRDNRVWRGAGGKFQGIFFRNYPGEPSPENIVIEKNIIVGSLKNGISAVGTATVKDNVVIELEAGDLPHITWAGAGVSVTGNEAPKFTDQAVGYRTPIPAGNKLNATMTAAAAQKLLDGWRSSAPTPVPDPVPTPEEPAPEPSPEPGEEIPAPTPPAAPVDDLAVYLGPGLIAALDARYVRRA